MANLMTDYFPAKFLRAEDVPDEGLVVTIVRLAAEEVGRKRRLAPVLHLRNRRPLILNKANAENLVAALGTGDYTKYAGHRIVLRRCQVEFEGKQVDSVRIDREEWLPTGKPKQVPSMAAEPDGGDDSDDEGWVDA